MVLLAFVARSVCGAHCPGAGPEPSRQWISFPFFSHIQVSYHRLGSSSINNSLSCVLPLTLWRHLVLRHTFSCRSRPQSFVSMEVAGLVLGAVGIAGVIGAFKDAVDVFALIADSRQLGRDYEVLESKVDIEKTVLLQWANRTKLLKPDYDRRLNEPSTQRAVLKILTSIHLLLSDAESLRQRYGLETRVIREEDHGVSALVHELACDQDEMSRTQSKPADEVDPSPISKTRMKSFINEFQALQLRMHIGQSGNSKTNRFRWIVADKAKFEVLIHDLTYLRQNFMPYSQLRTTPSRGGQMRTSGQNTVCGSLKFS